jgi:hypothetical protein
MNKLVIAYHAYLYGDNYMKLLTEQFRRLLTSGLFSSVNKMYIGVVDNPAKKPEWGVAWINNFWKFTSSKEINNPSKVETVVYPANNELADTMRWVRDYSAVNPGDYVLFFHSKGISHYDPPTEDWRRYMEYFVIDNWSDCIAKLKEGYDCCGVMWNSKTVWGHFPHFSGAFYWATTDYINTLNHSYLDMEWKYYREFWIGSNPSVKAFEFHNSRMNDIEAFNQGRSHYSVLYPPENYKK